VHGTWQRLSRRRGQRAHQLDLSFCACLLMRGHVHEPEQEIGQLALSPFEVWHLRSESSQYEFPDEIVGGVSGNTDQSVTKGQA
jgi:hypothetical protein